MNNTEKGKKERLHFNISKSELRSFYVFHELISEPRSFKINPRLQLWNKRFKRRITVK